MNAIRLAVLLCCLLPLSTQAQEFSGGFRAGLNFTTFEGDQETDASGMTLESFNRTTGFHVGATFAYAFTDLFGFKADLMYSQKGGEVLYDGPSYFYLYADAADLSPLRIQGELQSERDVLNSYIDVPVVAYYRLGPLELEGGFSAGLLVNSRASGSATFSSPTLPDGRVIADVSYNYDYNYFDDPIGYDAIIEFSQNRTNFPSVIDAYYNAERDTPLYRRLDFGLIGGAAFFLNNGLYLGVRYQYGLTDATDGDNDQRLTRTPGLSEREYNTDDTDNNRVIQTSIGFRF